ncbi:MAG: phBC6A51 family helix-turn-helix protein [Chloroflexi bacterium]|nr:phBC6A51 family helix-turn-helix protein [Chloroflexota bacterium]
MSADFKWTTRKEDAALLVAEDKLSDEKIAASCGVSDKTLRRWKADPAFRERVDQHLQAWREAIKAKGIAERQNRVDAANDRHQRLQRIIDARAEDADMSGVPGGDTGLLVRQMRGIGKGDDFERVDEYTVDTGLLDAMLKLEKQVAQDLGQWVEKSESKADVLVREYVGVPVDQV